MAFQIIPRFSDALAWQMTMPLEGVEYLMRFYWSTRESIWYLSIYNQDLTPIALWMALLVNTAPLRRFRAQTDIPPGVLVVADTTGQADDMTEPTQFGERVILGYVTSDDPSIAGVSLIGRA